MHQQSQAQSQAQNQLDQIQMAQLKEQNSMLKQQLASQAQTHINHLSQLIPAHQPPPQIPQQTPPAHPPVQAPEPSSTSTPPSNTTNFDTTELLKQVKEAMVTTMKEQQEKPVATAPILLQGDGVAPISNQLPQGPPFPSHLPSSSARHRSRSHRPRSTSRKPDKRPISSHRSPRYRRSHRDRSSRPPSRSPPRRRRSSSRHRSPGTSVTLRSTSPRRREMTSTWQEEEFQPFSSHSDTYHPPDPWQQPIKLSSNTAYTSYPDDPPPSQYASSWKSWPKWTDWSKSYDSSQSTGQWKDYKKSYNQPHTKGQWIDYSKPPHSNTSPYDSSTRPITAFSSEPAHSHRHSKRHQRRSRSAQSRQSTLPPGHVSLDLHGTSLKRWVANVKFAMEHPDRMPAANEIPPKERPVATRSIDEDDLRRAVTDITTIDERIPTEFAEQAAKLLLPDYELSTCYTLDLHAANMIALIMPLPDTSKFQMPPPFGKNHTWALLHGTTPSGAQQILLEGKIRPANWTKHHDLRRCDLPTFGAFYLGREVANNDLRFPPWALQELLCAADKKGKGQQEFIIGAMYHGAHEHKKLDAGGNEKAMLRVADNGIVVTSEKYTIANSHNVGLHFVAMKWENLTVRPNQISHRQDRDASSEDDVRYRSIPDKPRRRR